MPIHNWTRGHDCLFHDFHLGWIAELCSRLNHGILPTSHFAMSETIELRPPVGFHVLPEPDGPLVGSEGCAGLLDAAVSPPHTRVTVKRDRIEYASRIVTIRDTDTHAVVAAIMLLSQQDKQIDYRWDSYVRHAVAALTHGIHLLIIDLFSPNRRNPQGIHQAIWDRIHDVPFELPPDKPLTLAAYDAGPPLVAYVEPVAVGDALTDMPLFLKPEYYVLAPLEATYQTTWNVFPAPLKKLLEAPAAGSQHLA